MKWKGLLVFLAVSSAIASCGPGTNFPYRSTPTPTPSHDDLYVLAFIHVPTPVPTATSSPTPIPTSTPDIAVAKDVLSDGTYVWKWGAWRDPVTDKAYEEPPILPVLGPPSAASTAPAYQQPASSAATSSGGSLSEQCGRFYPERVEYWAPTAAQYDWDLCAWANIVDCESDGNEWIMNTAGSGACGVMQHLPCQYLGDGAGSIALGYAKYQERGWQPWTSGGCYPY